jgi:hypothetical protein
MKVLKLIVIAAILAFPVIASAQAPITSWSEPRIIPKHQIHPTGNHRTELLPDGSTLHWSEFERDDGIKTWIMILRTRDNNNA